MTDEELEDSSEETTEGTDTSVVPETEESSNAEEVRTFKEEQSTDEVMKMEHWRLKNKINKKRSPKAFPQTVRISSEIQILPSVPIIPDV